jgi:hypothetical protein
MSDLSLSTRGAANGSTGIQQARQSLDRTRLTVAPEQGAIMAVEKGQLCGCAVACRECSPAGCEGSSCQEWFSEAFAFSAR